MNDPVHEMRPVFNNRLLLQFHLARQELNCPGAHLQALFADLCINANMTVHSLRHLIQTALYQLRSGQNELKSFLDCQLQLQWLGKHSEKHGVSKNYLLSLCEGETDRFAQDDRTVHVTNGLLMEMNTFKNRKNIPWKTFLHWLQALSDEFDTMTPAKLNHLVTKISSKMKTYQKRKGDSDGASRLQSYEDLPCLPLPTETRQPSSTQPANATLQSSENAATGSSATGTSESLVSCASQDSVSNQPAPSSMMQIIEDASAELQNKMELKISEEIRHKFDVAKSQSEALKEVVGDKKQKVTSLEAENSKLITEINSLQRKLQISRQCEASTKIQLKNTRMKCTQLKRENLNRRHVRLQKKHQELEEKLHSMKHLPDKLQEEKRQKLAYQKHASRVESKTKRKKTAEELKTAEEVIAELLNELQAEVPLPQTRTESGYFKDFVAKCVYELVGECEVPAYRCRQVIQTVVKHFFGVEFLDSDLPGKTTSLRFADQSHALAKMQVAEETSKQKFDIHSDGTTKKQNKFVGLQVTLQNKQTLSLGFESVAQENAQTLLDVFLDKIHELSLLNYEDDIDENQIFQNIVGVMTDRASTMKCVGRLLDQHRASQIPNAVQMEFLHCNAHFMLGLSSATEKALEEVVKDLELGGKLGRENMAVFQSFASHKQSAVCR